MKKIDFLNKYKHIRMIDHTTKSRIFNQPNRALTSFAVDDAITTTVGEKQTPPTLRLWQHATTVVLGIPDTRLPHIEAAVQFVKDRQADIVVRNSGGLAVLLDQGVLNISMIVPNDRIIDIHNGYEMMLQFVKDVFYNETNLIKAYEIHGSYCPGDFDLSIDGIKFAGISQRRIRNGIAIQVYLDIEGESQERARFIKHFYDIGKNNVETKFIYPNVLPEKMGTISTLTRKKLTVDLIKERIKTLVAPQVTSNRLIEEEESIFNKRYQQMLKRNERI